MSDQEPTLRRLPRRELLRIAGIGGLSLAATGLAGGIPLSALAASAQEDTPEGFLAAAYAQRAQAMTSGSRALLDALYDPANGALVSFEKGRATYSHLGLGSVWNGTILGYTSQVSLLSLSLTGSGASARLYERIRITWIQAPEVVPSWLASLRQREPAKYASFVPRGPRGEIDTVVGIRHETTLTKGSTGWRIARDAYDERHLLYGASPDLAPGSWAEIQWGGPKPISTQGVAPATSSPRRGTASPLTQCSYNYTNAASYASNHCSSYNSAYCNYNPCGGDCADFVSQCFSYGGESQDGTWYTFSGACGTCGTSSSHAGSNAWANNQLLRN